MKQAISKRLLADQSIMNQLQGEFCVVKGYGNQEAADLFAVSGAHKAKNGDHYLYTINVKKHASLFAPGSGLRGPLRGIQKVQRVPSVQECAGLEIPRALRAAYPSQESHSTIQP